MDELKDLTESIRRLPFVDVSADFTARVMTALEKEKFRASTRIQSFLFRPLDFGSNVKNICSGIISSPLQYACLLFFIGAFYFIAGFFTLWKLQGVLANPGLEAWLRYQPYFALLSSLLLFALGIFIIIFKQKVTLAARNIIIGHTSFVAINALILEFILYLPTTIFFALILTAPAVLFGVFLISSIQAYIASDLANHEGNNCAETI